MGDEGAVRQMLLNLVVNAGHHTPRGTRVRVSVVVSGGVADIVVEDDGPGIPPEALPTLFDRFTQGAAAGTRERTTVGLGLAIVQALAAASGYTLDVTSRPGSTRFTVHIPLLSPPPTSPTPRTPPTPPTPTPTRPAVPPSGSRGRAR